MKRIVIALLTVAVIGGILFSGCVAAPPVTTSPPGVTYTLSVKPNPGGGGSISLSPAGGTYDVGTKVTLTAIPAQGYVFDHWSLDATGTSSSVTLTMDSSKAVVAYFTATPEPEPTPTPVTGSDGRLRIVVDKIERWSRAYPERTEGSFGVRPLQPSEGVDAIVVYLNLVTLKDICVGFIEETKVSLVDKSVLADIDGNECNIQLMRCDRVLGLLGSSCRDEDFFEEATMELYYPFPEYATPAKLKIAYPFLEPGEGRSIQWGQIDIILEEEEIILLEEDEYAWPD